MTLFVPPNHNCFHSQLRCHQRLNYTRAMGKLNDAVEGKFRFLFRLPFAGESINYFRLLINVVAQRHSSNKQRGRRKPSCIKCCSRRWVANFNIYDWQLCLGESDCNFNASFFGWRSIFMELHSRRRRKEGWMDGWKKVISAFSSDNFFIVSSVYINIRYESEEKS